MDETFKTNHINSHTEYEWSKYSQIKQQRLSDSIKTKKT